MKRIGMVVIFMMLLPSACWAAEEILIEDQNTRDTYSLGYDFGSRLKRQGMEVDQGVLLRAVQDGLAGRQSALSERDIRETLQLLRERTLVTEELRSREIAARNLREGLEFLQANAARENVKTLPSGLQYAVLHEGSGPVPTPIDSVTVHYRVNLVDGREFDSSYARNEPVLVNLNGVIKGWQEALQLMKAGSRWRLFIPPDLAYGRHQFGMIPPNSTLVFELELLAVEEGPLKDASAFGR